MKGWKQEHIDRLQPAAQAGANIAPSPKIPTAASATSTPTSTRAKANLPPAQMNKWERDYARHLQSLLGAGVILRWEYEPETLRLADRTGYTPDFRIQLPDGTIEFHEVKGFWQEDARVKFKVATSLHPYRIVAVSRKKTSQPWEYEAWLGGHCEKDYSPLTINQTQP